jgi:hypothetical protein
MKSFRRSLGATQTLLLALFCFCLLGVLSQPGQAQDTKIKVDPDAAKNYVALAKGVSPARLSQTITDLSGIHYAVPNQPAAAPVTAYSRVAGTPGGDMARSYVRQQFNTIFGAGNVSEEPFTVTTPIDSGAFVQGAGLPKPFALQPLWPNLVRTSTLPAAGIDGPLIYAGRGDLSSFRGKAVQGSIVLLDFNCGTDWLNAARLGAKAIVFIQPTQTMRGEGESKFIGIPVAVPRFLISRTDAAALQSAVLTTPNFQVHLSADNPWRMTQSANIVGIIHGTGPMADQNVVIESYYDSMSIVPTQAPGAESADGMAAMLEIARAFKSHPPKRTVMFVACGAHFLGIQGARSFIDAHVDGWRPISGMDSLEHTLFHKALPDRTNVLLFSGLDLTSQTGSVGVFYKGSFYDYREDIQSDFSDIGRTFRENAEKIGQTLGFDPATAFADGVNGAGGKTWRNYLPGRFAFDAEAATMAGGKGITFATTDDARQLTDTPLDTPDKVNIVNLATQTRLLACEYWHVLNDTNDPAQITPTSTASLMPVPTWPAWTRQGLRLGFCKLNGRVLLFDPKKNFVPDEPIADSLAVVGNPSKTMMGVRGNLIQGTEGGSNYASFTFDGLPLVISGGSGLRFAPSNNIEIGAYHIYQGDKFVIGNLPPASDDAGVGKQFDSDFKNLLSTVGGVTQTTFSSEDNTSSAARSVTVELASPQQVASAMARLKGQSFEGRALSVSEFPATRGDIDYAPDQGVNGAANYPTNFDLTSDFKQTQVIVFPCVATSIYDLIDQQALTSLTSVNIYDGASDGEPRQYGFILSGTEPGVSYVEDVAVLFSTPGPNTRLKVVMGSGIGAPRFLLINSIPSNPHLSLSENQRDAQGVGYAVGVASARYGSTDNRPPDPNNPNDIVRNGAITNTALRVAKDMWNLDDFRIGNLAKFRIVQLHDPENPLTHLHDIAKEDIDKALAAYNAQDYEEFDAYSRQAWANEARVYPQAQQTANDVVQGVIFYLFLLIPFAYFLERLLFGFSDLKRQLSAAFGIFLTIFLIFSQIHPAFSIGAVNPLIILIAFVMLALSVIVSLLVWGKFEEQLQQFNKSVSGVHKADVGKASIAFAAFALGISNMRRRKERTLLTCLTLVLLTFTVLSFTSIVNTIRYNDVAAPGTALYNGILLRLPTWDSLQQPAYRLLSDEYGSRFPVAPRAWFFGTQQGQQSFLHLTRAHFATDVKGVSGLTAQESQVTGLDKALTSGRWFNRTDTYSAIIPQGVATSLQITPADVGKVTINFSGVPYLVIGIVDAAKIKTIKDLDNETLTPVDYQAQQNQSGGASGGAGGGGGAAQGFQQYLHLDPDNVLYVPYNTLINMGGDLRSVAINMGSAATTASELKSLMPRLDLNLYAGENGANHRFSAIGATSSQGLINIIIPILIAALIVLNTMLGSVFERVKEIAIFSSIGLSPTNIAMLFIAEALVYGIIGAVSGYLIGQGLAKLISVFHILPGLYLNFSSTSAELAIGLVIAVVLLSTIFPARKASEVATPAVDRTWKVPEPDGDTWKITLPFAVAGAQANGINQFLAEWFRAYEEQSVGDFLTQDIQTSVETMNGATGYRLSGRIWLAPFDLGVSQMISLDTTPTDLEDVYDVHLTLTRVSGDVSNWKRVNRRFLNVVRKQFLIWRTLTEVQRERYLEIAEQSAQFTATEVVGAAL